MSDPTDKSKERGADPTPVVPKSDEITGPSVKTIPPPSVGGRSVHDPQGQPNQLAGRYELIEKLGEGGMGVVFRARDLELEEEIAIKLLMRQFTENDDDVRRFKREIKTSRRITHPNIIRIHDFGVDGRDAFISMEVLTGGTLADRLIERPSLREALRIAIQLCDGVAAAHAKGVIHRDIKPSNVLFDETGTVKVVDFGIARFASAATMTGGIMGTPHYMSPEQADGRDVGTFSDVYCIGIVLYETFTGKRPFDSDSLVKLAVMHVNEKPAAPREVNPALPEQIERVILRCIAKDPEQRYQTAGELAAALRDARDALGIEAGSKRPPAAVYEDSGVFHVPAAARAPRRRWLWVGVGAIVLGSAGVLAAWQAGFFGTQPQTTPTATPVVASTTVVTRVVTVTETATVKPTLKPTRKATPKPTPAFRLGAVRIKTIPGGVVSIDGKMVFAKRAVQHPVHTLTPGRHKISVVYKVPGQTTAKFDTTVTIKRGQVTTLIVQVPEKKVLKNETKTEDAVLPKLR